MESIYSIIDTILPFEWLEMNFMKNAFLAILIACPLFGTLGTFVVSNKMAFFSDAIGHSALTGVALGVILGMRDVTAAMVGFSVILGFAIITVKIKGKASADTIIGVFSSASVALGIVLLSATSSLSKYQKYLTGDILSIRPEEILLLFISGILLFVIWIVFYNHMLLTSLHSTFAKSRGIKTFLIEQIFALITAAIVTLSLRWTGLLVINSLLVLPAASARMISRSSRQYLGFSILSAFISGITGLCISYYLGSASGATIVLTNTVIFIFCLAFRKKAG
ncbi:metal ABC transporter permease [Treponema sp.]|uniref:metal ABC transporter permease n=1 Tax=Treponema sp. TaxID=166 RepID=UPI0025FC52B0|nr:metal ABC transporter permease [Treponema sp.]MCR5217104.1 metal ABC transporter permease [Treponema sp.]